MSQEVVAALRALVEPYRKELRWKSDSPEGFYTDTTKPDPKGKPDFFASAQVKKAAVSFYLMPVYCYPELLDDISPALKKRMQGKSCFNFKAVEQDHFKELEGLVKKGYQRYRKEGRI
jgi:hypothetical protein